MLGEYGAILGRYAERYNRHDEPANGVRDDAYRNDVPDEEIRGPHAI